MSDNKFEELREIVADIKDLDTDEIEENTLIKNLNFDSLDFVELQVTVKKKYDFTINSDFFKDNTTFIDMCNYIDNKG